MKVIGFGITYQIQGDDLQTYDQLPAATYKINFSPMSGFSMEKTSNFKQKEGKIYGDVPSKVEKTLKSFKMTNRSIGVLLSGDKGMEFKGAVAYVGFRPTHT